MSGGVDSSVSACLLVERGYEVIGLFMGVGGLAPPPPSPIVDSPHVAVIDAGAAGAPSFSKRRLEDVSGGAPAGDITPAIESQRLHLGRGGADDARFLAGVLKIPFHVLDVSEDFEGVINYFVDEYARGRTPNPCVVCNDKLKFGRLLDYADAVGADHVATGHYARIGQRNGRNCLMRGVDVAKDQSYMLFGTGQNVLNRVIFPVGGLSKAQVREIAARYNLPNRDRPDSMDICFVPDRDYTNVVRSRRPDAFEPGEVVDGAGNVLGEHRGLAHYTVGQRRGLGIAAGTPIYVTHLDTKNNRVVMGDVDDLLDSTLLAERARFLTDTPDVFRADVKIRYLHTPAPASVHRLEDARIRVVFDRPQRAITPGQAVVFYDGDTVLGGAWIASAQAQKPLGCETPTLTQDQSF